MTTKNIRIVEVESMGEITQHVIIDNGNDTFTSMPKAEYDRQQAEQSTPLGIE
jgi:hypothetical protein